MTIDQINGWLATSPAASYLRTALATAAFTFLTDVQASLPNLGLHPLLAALVAAAIPPALRALNPADGIFGKGEVVLVEDGDED